MPHVDDVPHRVHHVAGRQEEERLEKGVREHVKNGRGDRRGGECLPGRRAPQGQEHVAELADRRIGQHPLEIVLRERDQRCQEGRDAADRRDGRLRFRHQDEQRRAAGDQIDAGRHHRGRVNQGTHRRGAFHGVGKPEVQRELGRLAARSGEQAQANQQYVLREARRRGMNLRAAKHGRKIETAERRPNQVQADQKGRVADSIHHERFDRRGGGRRALVPEPDQEVAAQSDRFPKDKQHHEIAGHDEHAHRKDKQRQLGKEPRIARVAVHVAAGVNGDQQADERHHRQQDGRQGVNLHVGPKIQTADRDPVEAGGDRSGVFRDARPPLLQWENPFPSAWTPPPRPSQVARETRGTRRPGRR